MGKNTNNPVSETPSSQHKKFAYHMFEDSLFAELFKARCHDTGEPKTSNYIRNFSKFL